MQVVIIVLGQGGQFQFKVSLTNFHKYTAGQQSYVTLKDLVPGDTIHPQN